MSLKQPSAPIECKDFSAGFLDTPNPDSLPAGATPDAKNCILASAQSNPVRAVPQRRAGCRLIHTTVLASEKPVDGLFEFLDDISTRQLVAVCDGKVWVYDEASSTFSQVGASAPFVSGNPVRGWLHRNNLYLCDGATNIRYNGTALLADGCLAPTAAPALATHAPASVGVTGTYEGFAVWYDNATGHESSPCAIGAPVAFANQDREWTKPAGAPPANVTHWRVYCRRTDTYETIYYRTATVAVATASVQEAVIDTARREAGPKDNSNDVPPAFAVGAIWNGYQLAAKADSADLYVSKQGDPESQHPSDVFPIRRNEPVRLVASFGTYSLVQTDTTTVRVSGATLPFAFEDLHSDFGGVSAEAGLEVGGRFYSWDKRRGPYWTNQSEWVALADGRIRAVVDSVCRTQLNVIRAVHFAPMNLILWAVPTTTSGRKWTVLAYNYQLDAWLPPISGLEFVSFCTFTNDDGEFGLYTGDEWGRVYQMFSGDTDGPETGDTSATITGSTETVIDCAGAAFTTTGSGLVGMPVAVLSPDGEWLWARIQSNTATQITLDAVHNDPLPFVPSLMPGTWTAHVGAIDAYWTTPWYDNGRADVQKVGRTLEVQSIVETFGQQLDVDLMRDGVESYVYRDTISVAPPATGGGLIWGIGHWGSEVWGAMMNRTYRRQRMPGSYFLVRFRFANRLPRTQWRLLGFRMIADSLPGRLPRNV